MARVEYQFISDESAQLARYRAGQLDITDTVPQSAIPMLRREHPSELVLSPFLATAYYGFNLARPPFAENVKLRQAVAMAIDRKQLIKALGFGQEPAFGFVPPGTWNYTPQSWPWKDLSDEDRIAEAQRLYEQAGYSRASPLRLRLLFNANPYIKNTAIVIASMWKKTLGIETTLIDEEYRVFLQSRHDKSRWDVARLGWTADFNDASNFLDTFGQSSQNNDSSYVNPSFDESIRVAATTADAVKRRETLQQCEMIMLLDYPIVPLYFYVSKRLVKPFVLGVKSNPLNRLGSKDLTIKTQ